MSRDIRLALGIFLFICGLCCFLYPPVNGAILKAQANAATEEFIDSLATPTEQPMPSESIEYKAPVVEPTPSPTLIAYPELFAAMDDYNKRIATIQREQLNEAGAFAITAVNISEYGVEGNVAAVLTIPKLELNMPVYLGASEENMSAGAAVLGGTSLPIGGTDCNSVIAGHRGWNGAPYFLHIDQLQAGDAISITNLWGTLDYTVSEIKIIEPYALEEILIQPGRDLLTLMTCHPPSSGGRYRLLVICERTE